MVFQNVVLDVIEFSDFVNLCIETASVKVVLVEVTALGHIGVSPVLQRSVEMVLDHLPIFRFDDVIGQKLVLANRFDYREQVSAHIYNKGSQWYKAFD